MEKGYSINCTTDIPLESSHLQYIDYDADSEDEQFVKSIPNIVSNSSLISKGKDKEKMISSMIPLRCLEIMFSLLERELQLAKEFIHLEKGGKTLYDHCKVLLQSIKITNALSDRFINDPDKAELYLNEIVSFGDNNLISTQNNTIQSKDSTTLILDPNLKKKGRKKLGISLPQSDVVTSSLLTDKNVLFSVEELSDIIPRDRGISIMKPTLLLFCKGSQPLDSICLEICALVYEYWTKKRSTVRSSFLRGYHNYIMELWDGQQNIQVPIYGDYSNESLTTVYNQLITIRGDLDRARLIVDRVRKREKLKKDVLRVTLEEIDNELNDDSINRSYFESNYINSLDEGNLSESESDSDVELKEMLDKIQMKSITSSEDVNEAVEEKELTTTWVNTSTPTIQRVLRSRSNSMSSSVSKDNNTLRKSTISQVDEVEVHNNSTNIIHVDEIISKSLTTNINNDNVNKNNKKRKYENDKCTDHQEPENQHYAERESKNDNASL